MLNYVHGDIISNINPNEKTVIAHGCNCIHVMNAGLAKYLRLNYKGVYEADLKTMRADKNKLGTYSVYKHSENLVFLNCYTQFGIFSIRNISPFHYDALNRCLIRIAENYGDWKIRLPKIGLKLAKGNWDVIEKNIEMISNRYNLDVTIYIK
jgi:O-acetyl-ADP-ribose deacetylase (regulator of RNase III)